MASTPTHLRPHIPRLTSTSPRPCSRFRHTQRRLYCFSHRKRHLVDRSSSRSPKRDTPRIASCLRHTALHVHLSLFLPGISASPYRNRNQVATRTRSFPQRIVSDRPFVNRPYFDARQSRRRHSDSSHSAFRISSTQPQLPGRVLGNPHPTLSSCDISHWKEAYPDHRSTVLFSVTAAESTTPEFSTFTC